MHSANDVPVLVKRLAHGEGLDLPAYATAGAAGMDVVSAEDVVLAPGAPRRRHRVGHGDPAGVRNPGAPAFGPCAQARGDRAQHTGHDRFGLSRRTQGDPDQPGRGAFEICRGDRVAQLVLAPVVRATWLAVEDELDETVRGEGGFGSTGGVVSLGN